MPSMSERSTDKLLDTLITQISSLTNSVDKLVTMDAVRLEKDKHQDAKNEEVDAFIKSARPILLRLKTNQDRLDKVWPVVAVFFIIGFLTMTGVNFTG
tara:strand:- start:346 stop:639 length:294 start_codon:yes stop_codon:yes gene_type:complete